MRHFSQRPPMFHTGPHAHAHGRAPHHGVMFWIAHAALLLGLLLVATEVSADQQAGDLKAHYEQMAPQLARSPFQKPILLSSVDDTQHPTGEMHAVVHHEFATLAGALRDADAWCELLTLPANVKRCVVDDEAKPLTLHMAVGRKFDQPIEDAYALDFKFQVLAERKDYLLVEMSAAKGPMGTSDYRMTLEAIPLEGRRSFIRLRYAYANNFAARVATSAYLATSGRDKVGFTVVGRDEDGAPRYVGGIQGIAERNTMRYFLAIESYLDTLPAPEAQRLDKRLRDWFAATERYARQLHEQTLEEYVAMKHKEARRQMAQAAGE